MTDQDVQNLYEQFHTPPHVQRHCKAVADFAVALAKRLQKNGVGVNPDLLEKAALVHDLVRYVDFKEFNPATWGYHTSDEDSAFMKLLREKHVGSHHAIVGAQYLREAGFPEIAKIVSAHNFLHILEGFDSWEEKLLYYADKRAKHDTIVPLTERLRDGKQRNAPHLVNDPDSEKIDQKVFDLESELEKILGEKI